MRALVVLLCAVVTLSQRGDSARAEDTSPIPGTAEVATGLPSPLDLLYQAADDDLNSIPFDKSPLPQVDIHHKGDESIPPSTESTVNGETDPVTHTTAPGSSTATVESTTTTDISTTRRDQTTTESSSADSTSTDSTGSSSTSVTSTEAPSSSLSTTPTSKKALAGVSTTLSSRIFPTIRLSTRRPQENTDESDDSEEEETTPVVDIKKKPNNSGGKRPVRPSVWDAEDERIEKDIITKIFHGAMRNQERIRNRNLRRLLRRFQVLAFRADLSADEFHKFMRLVSEYTPSRIPSFLLRKSERRQFQETNRIRWQHIRDQMMRQAQEGERAEVIRTFLGMVERDGALRKRFGKPRRRHMTVEEFLRRQAPVMRRLLLPPHIEDHPLVRELLGGRRPPSPFFGGCCDF